MVIFHKKNTGFDLSFPLIDANTPRLFLSGASPTLVAHSQDGTGAWTLLTIADTVSEIDSTGLYEITLTAAELNHDRVLIKFTGGLTPLDTMVEFDLSPTFAAFALGPTSSTLDIANFVGVPNKLAIFKKEAVTFVFTIKDTNGVAVDMSGKTLRFTVETRADAPVNRFDVTGGSITVGGDSNEIVSVSVTSTNSDLNAVKYQWRLWDDVSENVFQHGTFEIIDTSESAT